MVVSRTDNLPCFGASALACTVGLRSSQGCVKLITTWLPAGEFAEAVRDQFLNERIEYYKELEDAIANAAAAEGMDMCTREHVKAALRHLDPDVADHVVGITLFHLGGIEIMIPPAE